MGVPITPKQSNLIAAVIRELKALGYEKDFIQKDFSFRDVYNPNAEEDKKADLVAFGEVPFSPATACFAAFSNNGIYGKELALKYRTLGAPYGLEIGEESIDVWKIGRNEDFTHKQFSIAKDEVSLRFQENANKWSSASVLRAKEVEVRTKPRQLDFFDMGLVPEVDDIVFQKLEPLLKASLATAKSTYKRNTGNDPDPRELFRLSFWLLAAKVYHDHDIHPFNSLSSDDGVDTVLNSIASFYGESPPRLLDRASREATFSKTWTQLDLRYVSIEVLIRIWNETYVTKDVRLRQGIHATPRSLIRYIVDRLPFGDFTDPHALKNENRYIVEPCSGSAAFLVASLRRLRRLWKDRDLAPGVQHKYFQKILVGFENETFGIEIGRLCLTLADSSRDHWNLREDNVFNSTEMSLFMQEARIVLCNPPFQDMPLESRSRYSITYAQKPAELLYRILGKLHPDGIIGFVLPQVVLDGQSYTDIRRMIAERFGKIEVVSIPDKAFRPASKETVLLLAYEPKKNNKTSRIIHRKVTNSDWKQFQLKHKPTCEDTAIRTTNEIAISLAVPELGRLWERLSTYATLGKLSVIHRGIEWNIPLTKNGKETGNRDLLVRKVKHEGYMLGVPPRAKDVYSFQVPELAYLDMRKQSLRNLENTSLRWTEPKIILNAKAKSRDFWRLAAFSDREGLVCYQTFTAIWPHDRSRVSALAAVLNGPVANAFVSTREGKTDITIDTLNNIPVPSFTDDENKQIEMLVSKYNHLVKLFRVKHYTAEAILKRIDAIVLNAYSLTPRLEKELLEKTRGKKRQVPFLFGDYYPADMDANLTLTEYMASEQYGSTAEKLLDRWSAPPQHVLDAMNAAVEAHAE